MTKPKLLVLIVAYNAENNIAAVLARVPARLAEEYDVEMLVLDDSSQDATFEKSRDAQSGIPFPVHVLFNPVNQGYGGNQKIGYHFAILREFDFVAPPHGDGHAGVSPDIVRPYATAGGAVFGSRMLTRSAALSGGMPLYTSQQDFTDGLQCVC
jgi:glycosyltransferase involved in cell wall biosynthesis